MEHELSMGWAAVSDLIKNDTRVDTNFLMHIEVLEVCMFFILIQFALHLKETGLHSTFYFSLLSSMFVTLNETHQDKKETSKESFAYFSWFRNGYVIVYNYFGVRTLFPTFGVSRNNTG